MSRPSSPGLALVELLVALLLVGVAAGFLVAALLGAERIGRRLDRARTIDGLRRAAVVQAGADSGCRAAVAPTAVELVLPAAPGRPELTVAIRCGP